MVHTGQTAHWIRYLNEDFILILFSSSPITNKPDRSHMLSYTLMHVTSVVCRMFCAHVCVWQWTNHIRVCFVSVRSCKCAGFTLEEHCQSSTLTLLLHTSLLHRYRNTFAITLLYLCTITDSDRVFPECLPLWCAKQTKTQFLVSVID